MSKTKIAKPKKYRQNHDVQQHFHPRSLARNIVHKRMEMNDMHGVNSHPGGLQSVFSKQWRRFAEQFAADAK